MISLKWPLAALCMVLALAARAEVNQARQGEILHLLRQDCGACHGMTLKGGLGPALTAGALRDKPANYLQGVILGGRPGTPMPPWRRFLSWEEVRWLVQQLKSGELDHGNP